MKKDQLVAEFPWEAWRSEEADIFRLGGATAARLIFLLEIIRRFEVAVLDLKEEGLIRGPVHGCVGQEANAVAVASVLRVGDLTSGSHRSHHHFLARLLTRGLSSAWDPRSGELPSLVPHALERALSEILGLAPGHCGGRGGSMHLRDADSGFLGSNAVVAGGIPIATGAAFASKFRGTQQVVVSFCGDGAVDQGAFHEACNLSGALKLPIVHFIENNGYAEATASRTVTAISDLSVRASSYGMRGFIVNGSDLTGLYLLAEHAVTSTREGVPPCIIESKCYRHCHHDGKRAGSFYGYRSREEEEQWERRDALTQFPEEAVRSGLLEHIHVEQIRAIASDLVERAVEFCVVKDGARRQIRQELWPSGHTVRDGLRSDQREFANVRFTEPEELGSTVMLTMAESVGASISRWLEQDQHVVLIGEGVADFWGILQRVPDRAKRRFPKQVFNMPISEAGFCGLACGAAVMGLKPIVELMYADFALVAADQLFNQIGKFRHLYGNTAQMPLVVRTKVAIGFGYGAQHSMDPAGLFSLFPGWRIVAPSNAADYVGLFNTAMHSLDPVLVIEYLSMYEHQFPVPAVSEDYCIPFGKARAVIVGKDLTIITYGAMTQICAALQERLDALGVSIELVDLRSLDMESIDIALLEQSATKTRRVLIVEQCAGGQGIGPAIAHRLESRLFGRLEGPVACLAAASVPLPASPALEAAAAINESQIFAAILESVPRKARSQVRSA